MLNLDTVNHKIKSVFSQFMKIDTNQHNDLYIDTLGP